MRSARSNTMTSWPARVSCCAAASPAGPEPTTATRLPVRTVGGTRRDPALVPGPVDDLDLDLLDRDRVLVDAEHARRLARRRAEPAGELGEVVGGVQPLDRVAPVVAVDEVVPVGDQVAERAAVVAERDAAVHAAPGLRAASVVRRERLVDLLPVAQPHRHRPPRRRLALLLEEPGRLTHARPPSRLRQRLLLDRPRCVGLAHHRRAPACSPSGITLPNALDLALPVVEQPLGDRRSR